MEQILETHPHLVRETIFLRVLVYRSQIHSRDAENAEEVMEINQLTKAIIGSALWV